MSQYGVQLVHCTPTFIKVSKLTLGHEVQAYYDQSTGTVACHHIAGNAMDFDSWGPSPEETT